MKYIVVDLEATCWEKRNGRSNEIIEIGAVCVDERGEELGSFVAIVKPLKHPRLSDFCIQLTSITQEMVDEGSYFPEALKNFQDWITSFEDETVLCSWGFYDRNQFISDCELHHQPTDWIEPHFSIKHQYAKIKSLRRACGMKTALNIENFTLDGTHHRGIDDAKNIAKILKRYLGSWSF